MVTEPAIKKFFVKAYHLEPVFEKVYTSCIMEIDLNIPLQNISHLIVRRFQMGEVNSICYSDSVRLYKNDFFGDEKNNCIYLSTDNLGYGKSVMPVTYYVSVTLVIKNKRNDTYYYEDSETICAKTPDGTKVIDIYKEV